MVEKENEAKLKLIFVFGDRRVANFIVTGHVRGSALSQLCSESGNIGWCLPLLNIKKEMCRNFVSGGRRVSDLEMARIRHQGHV